MDAVVASASSPSKVLSPPTPQLAATRISPRKLNESIEKETTDLLIQNRPKRIKMMNDDDNVDVSAKSSTASLFKVDTSDMNEYNQLKRVNLKIVRFLFQSIISFMIFFFFVVQIARSFI